MSKSRTKAIVKCKNLSKSFSGHTILNNINLTIPEGKIIGLLGRNGAGKSTLIKIINGLITPSSGEVLVDNQPVGIHSKKHHFLSPRTYLSRQNYDYPSIHQVLQ